VRIEFMENEQAALQRDQEDEPVNEAISDFQGAS
jgi:hypothetical protein